MELEVSCTMSNEIYDHGISVFNISIMENLPLSLDELKEGIKKVAGENYDFTNISQRGIEEIYKELTRDYPMKQKETKRIGDMVIMKLKCTPYTYSFILSNADWEKRLFDATSYFFAPSCNDLTGDDVAKALEYGYSLPTSGENRDVQIRGYVGAYVNDSQKSPLNWKKNTLAQKMCDEGKPIENIWYIDRIFVHPQHRGKRYGIIATALFLHKMLGNECCNLVCTHPRPIDDWYHGQFKDDPEKGKKFALHYLVNLFPDHFHYDEDTNLLWQYNYQVPEHLWDEELFLNQ